MPKKKNELACKSIDTLLDVKVPVIYIRDLVEFVTELLYNYNDEVWINIGVDHGC